MALKIYKSFALASIIVIGLVNTCPSAVASKTVNEVRQNTLVSHEKIPMTRSEFSAVANNSFTEEQFNPIFSLYLKRIEVKGVNKRVALEGGYYDNYVDSLNWNTLLVAGGVGMGALIGWIPGVSSSWAAGIAFVIGALGRSLLNGDNGVIVRTKQVRYMDPVRGMMIYDQFVSARDQ